MKYLLFAFAIISTILIGISNANAYEVDFRYTSSSASPINNSAINYNMIYSSGSCHDNVYAYGKGDTTNTLISTNFYSPVNTLLGTSSKALLNNNCDFLGNFTGSMPSYKFNSRLYSTYTGSTINLTKIDKIICNSGMNINFNDTGMDYHYSSTASCSSPAAYWSSYYVNNTNNNLCFITPFSSPMSNSNSHSGTYCFVDVAYFFFNSGSGNVTFNITEHGTTDSYYYFLSDNPSLTAISSGVSNVILTENTNYVVMAYHYTATCPSPPCVVYRPTVSIMVNTNLPEWSCGNYGECMNGTQQRLCHDSNGILPDKLEFQVCYSMPSKSINIGFEDSKDVNIFYVQPSFLCIPSITFKSVEYPSDWGLNNFTNPYIFSNSTMIDGSGFPITNVWGYPYDTLVVTSEDSIKGIKSLKLWSIPPEQNIPYCPETGFCIENATSYLSDGNYSISLKPELQKNINESYMVSKDISFDYPNMTISLYAKKCLSPIQEWSGNSSLWGICGEGYYTNDKSPNHAISNTKLSFALYDYNTSETTMITGLNVKLPTWEQFEFQLHNLTTSHLYKMSLGLIYGNSVSSDNYCVYVDDININAYQGSIPCISYCDGSSFHKATNSYAYGCAYTIEEVSPNCIGTKYKNEIESCNEFCNCNKTSNNYLTYYQGNNETGICEWIITGNSDYCSDYCSNQELTTNQGSPEETMNKLSLFFSPIFIIAFIIMGIGAFLAIKSKSWEIFAIVVIVGFLIASVVWIEMAFIGICIMICVAYFIAKEHGSSGNK